MKHLCILLLLLHAIISCSEEQQEILPAKQYLPKAGIAKQRNTSVRLQPLLYSAKVTVLKKGEKVTIVDRSAAKSYIGRTHDYWYKILLSNGLTGWTYGNNIKLFSNTKGFSIDSYSKKLQKDMIASIQKELHGRWWSINQKGDFTRYSLSLFKSGEYIATRKGSEKEFKGTYTIEPEKNLLTFSDNTFLGEHMKYVLQGSTYFIECPREKYTYKFKKISLDPQSESQQKK